MSDPVILRLHPNLVADQFQAVRTSIERLGFFLRPRQADPCGCHTKGWMDTSIISEGIGKMVVKLMAVHVGIIRMEKFPCIVEDELKSMSVDGSENYTVREIKESSCMGAIVLLYYYLYWYLFLIRMNQRIDPTYCTEEKLNIDRLIKNLPLAYAFLEFRYLGEALKFKEGDDSTERLKTLVEHRAFNPFMASVHIKEMRPNQERKTMLVAAYRRALFTNLGAEKINDTAFDFTDIGDQPSNDIFNTITADTILRGLILMGGMGSTFERSNPLQKWKDMHQPIQVLVLNPTDGKLRKYNGKPASILSAPPYSTDNAEFKANATKACIYDHCSAALMMDVCRSFQKLAEVITVLSKPDFSDDEVFKHIHDFLQNLAGMSGDATGMTHHLKSKATPNIEKLSDENIVFTNKSDDMLTMHEDTSAFEKNTVLTKTALWLDEFRTSYPTRSTAVSEDVNRACFLFDYSLKHENECRALKWMEVIQSEMIKFNHNGKSIPYCLAYSLAIIASFMRNAWMVTNGAHSVRALTDRLVSTQGFRNVPIAMRTNTDLFSKNPKNAADPLKNLHDVKLMPFLEIAEKAILENMESNLTLKDKIKNIDPTTVTIAGLKAELVAIVEPYSVSFADIAMHAANQKRILDALTLAAKDFYRYPALAWPVLYPGTAGITTNLDRFDIIRERNRRQPEHAGVEEQMQKLLEKTRAHESASRAFAAKSATHYQGTMAIAAAVIGAAAGSPLSPLVAQSAAAENEEV